MTLNFSRGKNACISVGYAEVLYNKGSNGKRKSNPNEVEGKEFIGRIDSLIVYGTKEQFFTSLNFRTYRYIKLIVNTKDEPLTIDDLYVLLQAILLNKLRHLIATIPKLSKSWI